MPLAGDSDFDAKAELEKSADDLLNELKAEYGEKARVFIGKLSVDITDKQDDRISPEAFEKVMPTYMKRGVLIDAHSSRIVGKPLRYWMRDGDKGAEVVGGWLVYDDFSIDDECWHKILNQNYKGLSIGGMALPGKQNVICGKDGCYLQINGIELWEGSVVENPANPEATIMAVNELAKSDITVTPKDGLLTKNEANMADTDKDKKPTEETPSASEGDDTVRKEDETLAPPEEAASNDIDTKLDAAIDLLQSLSSRMDAVEEIVAPVEKADEPEPEEPEEETEDEIEKTSAATIEKTVAAALEKTVPVVLAKALQKAGFVAAERPNMAGGKPLIKDDAKKALTMEQIDKMSFEELAQVEAV